MYNSRGIESLGVVVLFLILPLACIWFSETLGNYTGPSFFKGNRYDYFTSIDKETPGCMIALVGWILLLLLPLIYLLI